MAFQIATVGAIAWTSPLGRGLDGVAVDDIVEFEAAGREEAIEVLSIR